MGRSEKHAKDSKRNEKKVKKDEKLKKKKDKKKSSSSSSSSEPDEKETLLANAVASSFGLNLVICIQAKLDKVRL